MLAAGYTLLPPTLLCFVLTLPRSTSTPCHEVLRVLIRTSDCLLICWFATTVFPSANLLLIAIYLVILVCVPAFPRRSGHLSQRPKKSRAQRKRRKAHRLRSKDLFVERIEGLHHLYESMLVDNVKTIRNPKGSTIVFGIPHTDDNTLMSVLEFTLTTPQRLAKGMRVAEDYGATCHDCAMVIHLVHDGRSSLAQEGTCSFNEVKNWIVQYNAFPIAEYEYTKRLPQFENVSEQDYERKHEGARRTMRMD